MRRTAELGIVAVALLVTLVSAEVGVRMLGGRLPDPSPWPSLESEVKATLVGTVSAQIDVVLVGDSTMESGVDPARLRSRVGIEAFNAAIPFSTPLAMEAWLEEVVLARLQPRVVVIGLGFDPAQTAADDDPLRRALDADEDGGVWEMLGRYSELVRRRRQLRDWPETLRTVRALESNTWTAEGFQTGYLRGTIRSVNEVEDPARQASATMSADNVAALSRLGRHLTEEGIAVVVVMEPVRCPNEACRVAVVTSPYHRQVSAVARRLGVGFLDTNTRRWGPELFVDDLHLTAEGVQRFTDEVGRIVTSPMATVGPRVPASVRMPAGRRSGR